MSQRAAVYAAESEKNRLVIEEWQAAMPSDAPLSGSECRTIWRSLTGDTVSNDSEQNV